MGQAAEQLGYPIILKPLPKHPFEKNSNIVQQSINKLKTELAQQEGEIINSNQEISKRLKFLMNVDGTRFEN